MKSHQMPKANITFNWSLAIVGHIFMKNSMGMWGQCEIRGIESGQKVKIGLFHEAVKNDAFHIETPYLLFLRGIDVY